MSFKVVVCIKQVPDTDDIKWTEHNTIQRDGLDSIINPYDLGALQLAKNVKFLNPGTEIIVVTMGPAQAESALKTALAIGADKVFLLSDKKFSGADTLATAYALSQFIKIIVPDFKLILCGQQAVDGDTAQTPSSMAEKLGIEQITNVIALKEITAETSVWIKDTARFKQEIKIPYPALIATTLKDTNIIADINGYIKAQNTQVSVLSANEICADANLIGLKGSPTQVRKAFKPVIDRNTTLIENESVENCAGYITDEINRCKAQNE